MAVISRRHNQWGPKSKTQVRPTIVDVKNQKLLSRSKWCDDIDIELSSHLFHLPDIADIVLITVTGRDVLGEVNIQVIDYVGKILQL